jgi:hypothetical protein
MGGPNGSAKVPRAIVKSGINSVATLCLLWKRELRWRNAAAVLAASASEGGVLVPPKVTKGRGAHPESASRKRASPTSAREDTGDIRLGDCLVGEAGNVPIQRTGSASALGVCRVRSPRSCSASAGFSGGVATPGAAATLLRLA